MKAIKKILIFLTLIIFTLSLSLSIFIYLVKDDIINKFKSKLDKNLLTTIEIGDFAVKGFKKLPFISLQLRNVTAYSSSEFLKENPRHFYDTLINVSEVYVNFNLKDIIRGNYKISEAQFVSGEINIETSAYGANYLIWKSKTSDDSKDNNFDLNSLQFKNIDFNLRVVENNVRASYFLRQAQASVYQKHNQLGINLETYGYLNALKLEGNYFLKNKNLNIQGNLLNENKTWTINNINIALNKTELLANGVYNSATEKIELSMRSVGADFKNVVTLLPPSLQDKVVKYRTQGNFSILGKISGSFSASNYPSVYGRMKAENGKIYLKSGVEITHISIDSEIENFENNSLKNGIIKVNKLNFYIDTNSVTCIGKVINLTNPYLDVKVKGEIGADAINRMMADNEDFKIKQGLIKGDVRIGGVFNNNVSNIYDFISNYNFNGYVNLFNSLINIKQAEISMPLFNILLGKNLEMQGDFSLPSNGSNAFISVKIPDFQNSFIYSKSMNAVTVVKARYFDASAIYQLQKTLSSGSSGANDSTKEQSNFNYSIKSAFAADTVVYDKFVAFSANANLVLNDNYISADNVQFKSMGGTFFGGGQISLSDKNIKHLKIQADLQNINASDLFESFNNFGQDFLGHKNLSGQISGNVNFTALLDSLYQINLASIWAESNVKIYRGELIGWEPLKALSKYVNVEELERVRFSTLENQITIENEVLQIPYMDIKSNAFNISGYGKHQFDNEFEYHIRVKLSDVLSKKAKKGQRRGKYVVEDDKDGGSNLYLKIEGNPDDFDVGLDLKSTFRGMRGGFGKEDVKTSNDEKTDNEIQFFIEEEKKSEEELIDNKHEEEKKENSNDIRVKWDDE